jgi:hypothetical protein
MGHGKASCRSADGNGLAECISLATVQAERAASDLSYERHQSGPHPDQTKSHSGSGDISAHRSSPSRCEQDGDRAQMAL